MESIEGVGDKGLLLARSVVTPSSQMIPLCMLNLDEKAKKLYKSTVVETCDPVLEVFDSVSSDHETSAARVGKVEHSDNNSFDLPDHLKVILEDCETRLIGEEQIWYSTKLTLVAIHPLSKDLDICLFLRGKWKKRRLRKCCLLG